MECNSTSKEKYQITPVTKQESLFISEKLFLIEQLRHPIFASCKKKKYCYLLCHTDRNTNTNTHNTHYTNEYSFSVKGNAALKVTCCCDTGYVSRFST